MCQWLQQELIHLYVCTSLLNVLHIEQKEAYMYKVPYGLRGHPRVTLASHVRPRWSTSGTCSFTQGASTYPLAGHVSLHVPCKAHTFHTCCTCAPSMNDTWHVEIRAGSQNLPSYGPRVTPRGM